VVLLFIVYLTTSYSVPVDIQFESVAPSGTLNILGTLDIPQSETLVPAVILLVGSGAQNRNELVSITVPNYILSPPQSPPCNFVSVSLSIFTQLSDALVAKGIAVLRYDKRECLQPIPGCPYPVCNYSGEGNCVDLLQLDPNDMILDAVSAVNFLRINYADRIDPEAISLIGHSQGCNVAAYTAGRISVKKVVQLMGTGVSLDKIILKQIQALIEVYETGYDICLATNGNPQYVIDLKNQIIYNSIELADATYWFSLINNGSLSNNTIIPLGGVTVKYWKDIIQWGDFNELYQTMTHAALNTPSLPLIHLQIIKFGPNFMNRFMR